MDYTPFFIIGLTVLFAAAVILLLVISRRQRKQEAARSTAANISAAPPKPQPMTVDRLNALPGTEVLADLEKQLRSGAWVLMILGAIFIITSGPLQTNYGWVLLIVGLMSFYFKDAAMFFVYGCTLIWAALGNMLSGGLGWIAFAAFQGYSAYHHFLRFAVYQRAETAAATLAAEAALSDPFGAPVRLTSRTGQAFPWIAALLGLISLFGIVGTISAIVVMQIDDANVLTSLDGVINFLVVAGVIGASVGLASVIAKHRLWGISMVGLITGALGTGLVLLISVIS